MESFVNVRFKTLCGCEKVSPDKVKYPPPPVYRFPIFPPVQIKPFDLKNIESITVHTREFELRDCVPTPEEFERLEFYPYDRQVFRWNATYIEKWRD